MKLSTLRFFVEVAAEGSFTRAAQKLYVSQPTLSRRIQELEAELGIALFIRHTHTLTLSSAGEQFLREATDVLRRVDYLTHMFDQQIETRKSAQLLKIGYPSSFNMGKMYELFEQFKISHPTIKFLIKQDTPMNLTEGLLNDQYDLVFNLSPYFKHTNNIDTFVFIQNHLQLALPIRHPLSAKNKLCFEELSQETFVLLERKHSPMIVDYVVNQFVKHGFNVKANAYVKSLDEGLSKVSTGEGLAFLYSGMNDGTLEDKYHIKIMDLENDNDEQNIVVARNEKIQNDLLKELFLFVKNNS